MEKKTPKKDVDFTKFTSQKFLTVHGMKTINDLMSLIGLPQLIIDIATVELLTKQTARPSITVDRVISANLHFHDSVEIKDIPKNIMNMFDVSVVVKRKVRHPTYDPRNPLMATKKEISEFNSKKKKDEDIL